MTTTTKTRFRDAGILAWLVIALPLSSVVAGITTLVIASRAGSADAVIDPVKRTAQIQERDLAADRRTAAFGLSGQLVRAENGQGVHIRIQGALPPAETLTLTLAHPLASSMDQRIQLDRDGDRRYVSTEVLADGHDWNVQLTPADGSWRLVGRLIQDHHTLTLHPALGP